MHWAVDYLMTIPSWRPTGATKIRLDVVRSRLMENVRR